MARTDRDQEVGMEGAREVHAPRGTTPSCRSWGAEAAMRMLHNTLDPEVAERPDDTLLVQSGKPVGVLRTHERAPRVVIANSLLVPKWATPEYFRELEDLGLIMYGQMTAGSWSYIGMHGIVQGT